MQANSHGFYVNSILNCNTWLSMYLKAPGTEPISVMVSSKFISPKADYKWKIKRNVNIRVSLCTSKTKNTIQ